MRLLSIWIVLAVLGLIASSLQSKTPGLVAQGLILLSLALLLFRNARTPLAVIPVPLLAMSAFGSVLLMLLNPWLGLAPYYSQIGFALIAPLPLALLAMLAAQQPAPRWLRFDYSSLVLAGLALAAWALMEAAQLRTRPMGPLDDINNFAALLYLLVLPLIAQCLHGQGRPAHWLVLAVYLLALSTTLSRGAYLAMAMAVLLIAVTAPRQRGTLLRLGLLLMMTLASSQFTAQGLGIQRTHDLGALVANPQATLSEDSVSTRSRLLIWESSLQAWREEGALTGTGLNTYGLVYPRYRHLDEISSSGQTVHNDYVQGLLEGGPLLLLSLLILGPLAALWMAWRAARLPAAREDRSELLGMAAATLAVAAHAVVNFVYREPTINLLVGLYLAQLAVRTQAVATPGSPIPVAVLPWLLRIVACGALIFAALAFRNAVIFHKLGDELAALRGRDPATTLALVERLARIAPENPYIHLSRIRVFSHQAEQASDPRERRAHLASAYAAAENWIRWDGRQPGPWRLAASLLETEPALAAPDTALGYRQKALDLNPVDFQSRDRLATHLRARGDAAAACEQARDGLRYLGKPYARMSADLWAERIREYCVAP